MPLTLLKDNQSEWPDRLSLSKAAILLGSWEDAENSWTKLRVTRPQGSYTREWIDFQVEILSKTRTDPLKAEIRIAAIQEMTFEPEISRKYASWLRESLDTGFFKEERVRTLARVLLIQVDKPSNPS